LLEPIAKAQKAQKVGDFWPYFRASVKRYVDANAEKIQALARRTGGDEGTRTFSEALAGLGIGGAGAAQAGRPGRARGPSMTELLAERAGEVSASKAQTLRERTARARAKHAACKGDGAQAKLW
jgi:hypothetical protein